MTAKDEGGLVSFQFNDPNHVHAVSGTSTGEALTYDNAGSIASRAGGETYTFDAENRMAGISSYPTNTSYAYDGQGNLAVRSTTASPRTGAIDDRTVYAGGVYEERSEYGIGINAKATVLYQAFGRVIATRTGTDTTYLLADHLGSTVGTVSSDGAQVHQVRYWPYGAVRSGGVGTDKMYTGQQMEAGGALGAYFYHARFYSTTLGHFLSADGASTAGSARYGYGVSNPIGQRDPSGYSSETPTLFGNANFKDAQNCQSNPSACSRCAAALVDCLWYAAQGEAERYIYLVADYWGVPADVLAAVIMNEVNHHDWKDDAANYVGWLGLLVGSDFLANRSWGIAQIKLSTARALEERTLEFRDLYHSDEIIIRRLLEPRWAVMYTGALLSYYKRALFWAAPSSHRITDADYIVAFRFDTSGWVSWMFDKGGCDTCGNNAPQQIRTVRALESTAVQDLSKVITDALAPSGLLAAPGAR